MPLCAYEQHLERPRSPGSRSNRVRRPPTTPMVTSTPRLTSLTPPCQTGRAVSTANPASRPKVKTPAPCHRNCSAMVRPIPWAAPVTMTALPANSVAFIFPVSFPSLGSLSFRGTAGDHKGLVKIPRIFLAQPLSTSLAHVLDKSALYG